MTAPEPRVEGIDVSKYQPRVDWKAVAASGKRFAFVRVADGVKHLDEACGRHLQGAQEAGLLVGAYLFWRADASPEEQAALLCSQGGRLHLPPVLDAEATSDRGLPRELVRDRLRKTIEAVEAAAGRCMLYTAAGWWETWMGPQPVGVPLWVAHYGVERPMVPTSWHRDGWRFWQHSGTGRCPGIEGHADLNVWSGTPDELEAFAGSRC